MRQSRNLNRTNPLARNPPSQRTCKPTRKRKIQVRSNCPLKTHVNRLPSEQPPPKKRRTDLEAAAESVMEKEELDRKKREKEKLKKELDLDGLGMTLTINR